MPVPNLPNIELRQISTVWDVLGTVRIWFYSREIGYPSRLCLWAIILPTTAGLEPAFLAVNFLSAYGAIVGATTIAPHHEEVVERKMNWKGVGVMAGLEPALLRPAHGLMEATIGATTIAPHHPKR
ncbi:uncharacterized protein EI90DRAFT_3120715 [Cantharellus anzutake]|uniref:uncharacterized protein n=1 Tax=Cantharellus anzutake TaxID=1750568 RepID=UPI0019060195|nr:uncharacterized protein EI90DRAFT_3120715 [Cantharellus anzutake]KAF8334899.1 hypothetical protein EI90DRAFT_3120715 [Cantharellus anzutake]